MQYWLNMRSLGQQGTELTRRSHPRLHESARTLADETGVQKPELRLLEDDIPNAYAVDSLSNGIAFFTGGFVSLVATS